VLLSVVSLLKTTVVKPIEVQWRAAVMVLVSVTLFAVCVKPHGLGPAVLSEMIVSSFAESKVCILQVAPPCSV